MSTSFKISLAILVVTMYLVGYISWRVQNDALKRGYNRTAATFWSLGVFFFPPLMLPLYILLRGKVAPQEPVESELEKAKKSLSITCRHCGEQNSPDSTRCQKCETLLIDEGKSIGRKSCPYCGETNDVNAIYCANCRQGI
jgi:ribosomal protein L40E